MQEFFLVILICWSSSQCQLIHKPESFPSMQACISSSVEIGEVLSKAEPDSSGVSYCLTKEEYDLFLEKSKPGSPV